MSGLSRTLSFVSGACETRFTLRMPLLVDQALAEPAG